jgi:predicted signal transduction protein with EAL and GGDEF domain
VFEVMDTLRAMGISLAINDFGTGYSSLSYLRRFPIRKLKIDRGFVNDLAVDKDDEAIVGTIINMAKGLSRQVTAEGVETTEQLAHLRHIACDEVQGLLPMTAHDAEQRMLKKGNPRNAGRAQSGVFYSRACIADAGFKPVVVSWFLRSHVKWLRWAVAGFNLNRHTVGAVELRNAKGA